MTENVKRPTLNLSIKNEPRGRKGTESFEREKVKRLKNADKGRDIFVHPRLEVLGQVYYICFRIEKVQ